METSNDRFKTYARLDVAFIAANASVPVGQVISRELKSQAVIAAGKAIGVSSDTLTSYCFLMHLLTPDQLAERLAIRAANLDAVVEMSKDELATERAE